MMRAMIKLMAGLALALTTLACGGAPKRATPAAPTCDDVAASARAAWLAGPGSAGPEFAELAPTVAEVVAERCVADAWAPATMACLARATGEAFEACGRQLTEAQRESLDLALAARATPPPMPQDSTEGGEDEGGTGAAPPKTSAPPPPHDPCGGDE